MRRLLDESAPTGFNPQPASTRAATLAAPLGPPHIAVFQSSARINTGCNVFNPRFDGFNQCFNPQPASTRAATTTSGRLSLSTRVSILSPHQHGLQPTFSACECWKPRFQSSARINTGCNADKQRQRDMNIEVSILSPHQHGLQPRFNGSLRDLLAFQSSARINTGCNERINAARQQDNPFQSSARINTGCNKICVAKPE